MHLSTLADRAFFSCCTQHHKFPPNSIDSNQLPCHLGLVYFQWADLQHNKEITIWEHGAFSHCCHFTIQINVFHTFLWSKEMSVLYQAPTWSQMYSWIWSVDFSFCSPCCREYGNLCALCQTCRREHSFIVQHLFFTGVLAMADVRSTTSTQPFMWP